MMGKYAQCVWWKQDKRRVVAECLSSLSYHHDGGNWLLSGLSPRGNYMSVPANRATNRRRPAGTAAMPWQARSGRKPPRVAIA